MDIDQAEAAMMQDRAIKRETSDGVDGGPRMSQIPETANNRSSLGPRSSQPHPMSQADPVADDKSDAKLEPASRAMSKKGTARLVKRSARKTAGGGTRGGRKSRGGGRSGASSRAKKTTAASTTATHASSEAGASDEDESDHGPYCICRGPDDHRWMISCDMCDDWFHGECVNIDKTIGEALIQRYVCPGCTDRQGIHVTRYKKTCSLEGCWRPARIYDEIRGDADYSVFCSDRHAEDWWEQLVRSLPENRCLKAEDGDLTREKFMGLLNVSAAHRSVDVGEPWHPGKKPFGKSNQPIKLVPILISLFCSGAYHSGICLLTCVDLRLMSILPSAVPSEFWSHVDQTLVFTPEEQSFLAASAADRYALAEEIVLNKKMQQLLDLANERRKAAITEGLLEKDVCGYDSRLDLVGCPEEFGVFVKSAQGEAIYRNNSLATGGGWTEEQVQAMKAAAEAEDGREWSLATAGMCGRRRCKPHASWYNIFTKSTRHLIKELARQAKEKLDAETRVREAAATRYFRRRNERTSVTRLDEIAMT
jgi:COMPASS component SPP1